MSLREPKSVGFRLSGLLFGAQGVLLSLEIDRSSPLKGLCCGRKKMAVFLDPFKGPYEGLKRGPLKGPFKEPFKRALRGPI